MTNNEFLSTLGFTMLKKFFYAIKLCETDTFEYRNQNHPYLSRTEVEHFINILKYLDEEDVIKHLYNDIELIDYHSHCNADFEESDTYREMMSVLYDENQGSFYTTRDDFDGERIGGHSSADCDDAEIIFMFYKPYWYNGR